MIDIQEIEKAKKALIRLKKEIHDCQDFHRKLPTINEEEKENDKVLTEDIKALQTALTCMEMYVRIEERENMKVTHKTQLRVIQGLCDIYESGSKDKENTQGIIDDIYKFSHINGTCKNPHLDWHKECMKAYKTLKRYKII